MKFNHLTFYEKYVSNPSDYGDLKRLNFIVSSVRENFKEKKLKGLDLGCGRGRVTVLLASLGYEMIGIDIDKNNIKEAEKLKISPNNPIFLIGDAENFKPEPRTFDFVVCSEVLEHLKNPEKVLRLIKESLKEKGILILTIPNGYGPYSLIFDHLRTKVLFKIFPKIKPSSHFNFFSFVRINNLLKKQGFKILRTQNSNFLSFFNFAKKSKFFTYLDCKLADKLPHFFASGFYILAQK